MPVIRQLEGQTSMVRSLDGDDVGAEVGAEQQAQRADLVGALGLASRQVEKRELFVGLQHHKLGTKFNTCFLLLVIVDLDGGVVGDTEADHTCLVTCLLGGCFASTCVGGGIAIGKGVGSQQRLHLTREFLSPELFVFLEHVRLTGNGADFTRANISDVDTLVLVQGNGLAVVDDFDFNGGEVLAGSVHHPFVTGAALDFLLLTLFVDGSIFKLLGGSENKSLFLAENVNFLDARQ
eukprot:Lithocolla_globosa_v1_NODE_1449_length_2569_cov_1158.698886.p2 type:complete len:236 gc:universal NODE_1449_length_2569_cov_1158.698886:1650-943(-)